MSANLLVDQADPVSLASVIGEVDPDIIAIQELGFSSAKVIAASHPHGHLDPRDDFFGLGIAAKRPVVVERLDQPERAGWVARLDPEEWPELASPIEVLDVHLLNPLERPWKATQAVRRQQIAGARDRVETTGLPSVIVGDMNSTPMWPEYKLLAEIGVDAAKETGTAKPTWFQTISGPRAIRIDHAFVRGLTPITTSLRKVHGSDHRALILDIEASA